MKATGIVRRIDDLGRVVIPKEIRRTMHIKEGAPLEIFTDTEGGVIFKKYSQYTLMYSASILLHLSMPISNLMKYYSENAHSIFKIILTSIFRL